MLQRRSACLRRQSGGGVCQCTLAASSGPSPGGRSKRDLHTQSELCVCMCMCLTDERKAAIIQGVRIELSIHCRTCFCSSTHVELKVRFHWTLMDETVLPTATHTHCLHSFFFLSLLSRKCILYMKCRQFGSSVSFSLRSALHRVFISFFLTSQQTFLNRNFYFLFCFYSDRTLVITLDVCKYDRRSAVIKSSTSPQVPVRCWLLDHLSYSS